MDSAAVLAAAGATVMIAVQVAGRATRDGLFLSNFDISVLPSMIRAASLVSLVTLLAASRAMARLSLAKE